MEPSLREYSHAYVNQMWVIFRELLILQGFFRRRAPLTVVVRQMRATDELACGGIMLSVMISKVKLLYCFGREKSSAFFNKRPYHIISDLHELPQYLESSFSWRRL